MQAEGAQRALQTAAADEAANLRAQLAAKDAALRVARRDRAALLATARSSPASHTIAPSTDGRGGAQTTAPLATASSSPASHNAAPASTLCGDGRTSHSAEKRAAPRHTPRCGRARNHAAEGAARVASSSGDSSASSELAALATQHNVRENVNAQSLRRPRQNSQSQRLHGYAAGASDSDSASESEQLARAAQHARVPLAALNRRDGAHSLPQQPSRAPVQTIRAPELAQHTSPSAAHPPRMLRAAQAKHHETDASAAQLSARSASSLASERPAAYKSGAGEQMLSPPAHGATGNTARSVSSEHFALAGHTSRSEKLVGGGNACSRHVGSTWQPRSSLQTCSAERSCNGGTQRTADHTCHGQKMTGSACCNAIDVRGSRCQVPSTDLQHTEQRARLSQSSAGQNSPQSRIGGSPATRPPVLASFAYLQQRALPWQAAQAVLHTSSALGSSAGSAGPQAAAELELDNGSGWSGAPRLRTAQAGASLAEQTSASQPAFKAAADAAGCEERVSSVAAVHHSLLPSNAGRAETLVPGPSAHNAHSIAKPDAWAEPPQLDQDASSKERTTERVSAAGTRPAASAVADIGGFPFVAPVATGSHDVHASDLPSEPADGTAVRHHIWQSGRAERSVRRSPQRSALRRAPAHAGGVSGGSPQFAMQARIVAEHHIGDGAAYASTCKPSVPAHAWPTAVQAACEPLRHATQPTAPAEAPGPAHATQSASECCSAFQDAAAAQQHSNHVAECVQTDAEPCSPDTYEPPKGCSLVHDLSTAQQQLVLLASCKQEQAPID